MFMNKAFRKGSFNLATCGTYVFFLMLKMVFFPIRRKKIKGEGKRRRKKRKILIKIVTEIPTKVKNYKQ